ncbi:MAG: ABC transporter substrate-binding protein [Coriobacteriales bacterium]|jgi:iron complex transport system substrate-binding protein|nr:ABC transporter substrate-binding protein [Coriobacteriales bacterium]
MREKRGITKTLLAAVLAFALATTALMGCAAGAPQGASGSSSGSGAGSGSASGGAASPAPATGTRTVVDMLDRKVEIPAEVNRVIGLGSSSLRMIAYLEQVDKVIGVELAEQEDTVTCAYRHIYHEEFAALPVVGEGGSKGVTPNEEAIIQAAPEVIIASIDKDSADSLAEKTNIPVICITLSDIIFDQIFYDNTVMLGEVLGAEQRADELIAYIQDVQADLKKRTDSLAADEVHSAYAAGISFRGGHGFAGTEAHFPPFEAVRVTNIADVASASGAYDIDLEEVSAAQPDFIFIESGNYPLVKEDYDGNPAYFAALNAVQQGKLYSLISYRFYATNVELALANCYQVGSSVYPAAFSGIDPTAKLDEITTFFLGKPLSSDLADAGYRFEKVDLGKL